MTQNTKTDLALLILRLSLATMLIAHGLLKILVFTIPGTVQFFTSAGFPGWSAYIVILLELGGGALLLAGLFTRWTSIVLIPVMIGAVIVHSGNGWVFSNANGGWEYPAFLLAVVIVQSLLGPGNLVLFKPRSPI